MPLHRFVAPVLPVLFVLVAGGFDHLREGWNQIKLERKVALFTIRTLTLGWILVIAAVLVYPSIAVITESQVRPELYRHSHIALGHWLRQQCDPGDRVALSDIGQIGYYSDLPAIDLVGLTDRTIAHSPGGMHKKQYDPLYVLNQKPRYVVLVCAKVGGRWVIRGFETDKRLYHHPRFKSEYRLLPEVSLSFKYKDDYSYWVFKRIAESEPNR